MDGKAAQIIQNSNLIYVYGMSIGETDKLWWGRICTWLNSGNSRHLIVQKYDMPEKSVLPTKYQRTERQTRRDITKYSSLENDKKKAIEARIHITGENIFSDISNIAQDSSNQKKTYATLMEQIQASEKELLPA